LTFSIRNDSFSANCDGYLFMKIKDSLAKNQFSLSFEVFPPDREGNLDNLYRTIEELRELKPDFISVTYGAGGATRDKTIEIASKVLNEYEINALAHLTCVQATKDDITRILDTFVDQHIENILALRGDPPKGETAFVKTEGGFGYASDLVAFIAERERFCIGVAGYPEKHIEAPTMEADLKNLKHKVDAGADFIISQLFFNNDDFYRFRDLASSLKIRVPIIPGIFPILNYKQIFRIVSLCDAKIPARLGQKIEKLKDKPEEIKKYGIEYATKQAAYLMENEVHGLHFYSMNKSDPVKQIVRDLKLTREK
jgi:methylenetetrahydrofolate reductase (NADPH)